MEKPAPKISVIITVLNSVDTIERSLRSVISQSHKNVEIVVVDGGSTDGTKNIIKKHETHISSWISEKDNGIYNAMNKGIRHATGDWIIFLGAGDFLWEGNTLEKAAMCLESVPSEARIAYGQVIRYLPNGNILDITGLPWEKLKKYFLRCQYISHQGVFHHKAFFKERGLFDETFSIAGDYELLLRELKENTGYFLDFIIAAKEFSGISVRPENLMKALREVIRAKRKNDVSVVDLLSFWQYFKVVAHMILVSILGPPALWHVVNLYRKIVGRNIPVNLPRNVYLIDRK